jgi:alkaline phosphatase D
LDNAKETRPFVSDIFSFLAKKINGVVLMSADRHRSDAWKIERPDGYTLTEFNSSRLTNRHFHKTMPKAIFSYNAKQSFGLVAFDTLKKNPTVTYQVVNIDGKKVHSLTLRLSQLTQKF